LSALKVSKEEYDREVEELKRLRNEYNAKWSRLYYIVSRIRYWETRIANLTSRLEELRRIGWIHLKGPERREYLHLRDVDIPRARAYRLGWDTERVSILTEIRREKEEIRRLEAEIARKVVVPVLHRIKIRLYNEEISPDSPTGQFQGWFDIDAIMDPKTGMPKWDWWLTDREIRVAKRDMWAEFNAPESWKPIEGTLLAYMEERKGIAPATPEKIDETPVFRPRYPKYKPIPEELKGKFTIEDLIVGLSSVAPTPVTEPEGVFKQKIMVIKEDEINYYREINQWIWRIPRTVKEQVKKELGLG
jgi:hypothetical protein